jgi:Domain of unknown function (DUF6487)
MASTPVCLVCKKEMEQGFLTDFRHFNVVMLPRWCPGPPEPASWWTGGEVKNSQAEAGLKVVAFRCPECEALRLYAPSSDSQH